MNEETKHVDECTCHIDECACDCCQDVDMDKHDCHEINKKEKTKKGKKDKMQEELTKLNAKIKELEEKNLREKAELINYRKRKEEEVIRMMKYCNEELIKEILPTLDNFERAIDMDDENLDDEVSKFLAGVKMIYANLINVLEKFEVKAIDGKNKPFDPTYHNAVMTDKVEGMEPGMVIEVLQKGYMLKDKVIRPAMVRVSE